MDIKELKEAVEEFTVNTHKFKKDVKAALESMFEGVDNVKEAACMLHLGISSRPSCRFCDSDCKYCQLKHAYHRAHIGGWRDTCCSVECSAKKAQETILQANCGIHYLSKDCADQSSREKQKATSLINHGVDHISKSKEIQRQKKETILERNKGFHYMDVRSGSGVQEKIKSTVNGTYGADHFFQTETFKEKAEQTSMERYGVSSTNAASVVKLHKEESIKKKFGAEYVNPGQVPDIKEKIKQSNEQNWENGHPSRDIEHMLGRQERSVAKYGVPFIQQTEQYKKDVRIKRLLKKRTNAKTSTSDRFFELLIDLDEKEAIVLFLEELKETSMEMTRISVAEKAGISPWDMGNLINRYPECREFITYNPVRSNQERVLFDLLSPCVDKIEYSNRKVITPKELDILIDGKVAIEVNGIFYHSELNGGKSPSYHVDKTNLANAAGVKLFHFYDTEINQQTDIVVSMVKNSSGYSSKKYQARKLEVCKIEYSDYSKFFSETHIQGSVVGSDCYALKEGEEIKFAMLVGKPRFNKDHDWEVLRVSSELNSNVSGGFGRVWSAFMKEHNPESVICYQDRRFGGMQSSAYGSCMTLIDTTSPGWSGVDIRMYCIRNRSYYMKHRFSQVQGYDSSKSVLDNMVDMKHDRIWNCGQYVWSYKNSSPNSIDL